MDKQPAKRRKTSPAKTTPVYAPSSPGRTGSARASFMSPTRASISRFNPSLLPQPRSANAGPARRSNGTKPAPALALPPTNSLATDEFMARGQQALNFIMSNFGATVQNVLAAQQGRTASPASVVTPIPAQRRSLPAVPTGLETDEEMEAMRAAIQARKETERAEGGRQNLSKSSEEESSSRPASFEHLFVSPRPDEDDDELSMGIPSTGSSKVTPITSGRDRGSELRSGITTRRSSLPPTMDIEELDELSPDAPLQDRPAQRQTMEPDELPETPDKFRQQMETENQPPRGVLYSSPSKRRRSRPGSHLVRPLMKENGKTFAPHKPSGLGPARAQEKLATSVSREPLDLKILAKKDTKAMLETELRSLRAEVRQLEGHARTFASDTLVDDNEAKNFLELINLMNLLRNKDESQTADSSISNVIASFLPFSVPKPRTLIASENAGEEDNLITHEPIVEKNPLPMSSLFTPLAITGTTQIPRPKGETNHLLQSQSITLQSPGALLSCSVNFDVSTEPSMTEAPTVETLRITELSSWAQLELGSWLENRCAEGDIAAVGYSLGRYWDISVKRAQCWMECQKAFPDLFEQLVISEEELSTADDSSMNANFTRVPRRNLLPLLGKQFLIFKGRDAVLTILWKLKFDWTGEVESVVSAEAALPRTWHETDMNDALRKIPTMFDALMRDKGVVQATKVIAGLLFSAERL